MAPLILHNVPDDELYVGDDGVQRPYAMVFPQPDGMPTTSRSRRAATETGSFGKSTRRSRSRTGTPARRENPTLAAADKIFSDWVAGQQVSSSTATAATSSQRKSSAPTGDDAANASGSASRPLKSEPTEVILRGYRSDSHQWAAINHYEQLAGRICEDYPREPPPEQRRYKGDLRDRAFTRRRALTPEERAKVNRADGGEHWIKVTFESAEAADAAIFVSPQRVLGHLVFAEPYRGVAPSKDEAVPDVETLSAGVEDYGRSQSVPAAGPSTPKFSDRGGGRSASTTAFPASALTTPNARLGRLGALSLSPPDSRTSSQTLETGTLSTSGQTSTSTATVTELGGGGGIWGSSSTRSAAGTGAETSTPLDEDSVFCRKIPTARRARLLPADQALLPQPSYTQRLLNGVPFLKWFSGSMIGNEVPRTDSGDFDWNRASLYWKIIWVLDSYFSLFGGEIVNVDKDD